jgi:glycosyltransferase involved in cell wall biosynthesis
MLPEYSPKACTMIMPPDTEVIDASAAGGPPAQTPIGPALEPCANTAGSGRTISRILAVWTRDLDAAERFGRVNVARQVRVALREIGPVMERRLTNAFEDKDSIGSVLSAVMALFGSLLRGSPLPLQCALFAAAARRSDFLADALQADVVYLDGVRTILLLRRLRRFSKRLRIVVDLDDLMSRRYEQLSRQGLPLSLGYLGRMVPRAVSRLAVTKWVARLVLSYECLALRHVERDILRLADSVVLLNRVEGTILQASKRSDIGSTEARVVAIPPIAERADEFAKSIFGPSPSDWRAVFVGSDILVQNRLTIAYLLDLWRTFRIETELHIYGRQEGSWPIVPNVTFVGYVPDIRQAYRPGSVMVYPCLLAGGIKTKVLEAFAHGVPVVGNEATFESILPPDYPLVIDDEAALVAFLKDPAAHAEGLAQAASLISSYLAREHTARRFLDRWRDAMLGSASTGEAQELRLLARGLMV